MKYFSTTFLLLTQLVFCCAQLTINISSVPDNTPQAEPLYFAGNANGWNPGDADYQFTSTGSGQYTLTFTPLEGEVKFKITRGSWATVEGNASGGYVPDRTYQYTGGAAILDLAIDGWEDLGSGGNNSTASDNVLLLDDDFYMPQLDRNRRIWIYLPPDYDATNKTYPVFYAQDGQNLFDQYLSFSGEWEMDESLNALFDNGDAGAIVVGIENGGAERINEYSPWIHPQYGGGQGDEYAAFIAETLKPYIDANYRTRPERESTGIIGSSMGGLISLYAAVAYQEVFGKAGVFSPSLWFSDEVFSFVSDTGKEADLRFYLLAGALEDNGSVVADNQQLFTTLVNAGFDASEINVHTDADGQHSEWYWAREFPDAYEWLCATVTSTTPILTIDNIAIVFPNPVRELLHVQLNRPTNDRMRCQLVNMGGQLLMDRPFLEPEILIDTSYLKTGSYLLQIVDNGQVLTRETVVVK